MLFKSFLVILKINITIILAKIILLIIIYILVLNSGAELNIFYYNLSNKKFSVILLKILILISILNSIK